MASMFPMTVSNQISYRYFCALGGLSNPRCGKMQHWNGNHHYATYHLIDVR